MAVFTGAGVALITPFDQNNQVNYDKLDELIEFQIAGKTDSIVICGTTGEASTLSHEEHLDVIKFTAERVKGRIPVVAGTGSNSTETAVFLSTEAEKNGADALLVVSPYYNKATQAGLAEHFKIIADSVKVPIILYNIPGRTGVNIKPETVAGLMKNCNNVVGMKEASGDISQVLKLMSVTDGNINLYSGNDDQIVPLMSVGGKGVISVLSNVLPELTHDIPTAYLAGNVDVALKKQLEVVELIDALFCEVNPIPVKHALNLMGMDVGALRRPLSPMEPKNLEILRTAMLNYGLIR